MKRIAINGFGRIGRLFFRQALSSPAIEIVAINDLGDLDNLAYLLQYDSVYGTFEKQVQKEGNGLSIDGKIIAVFQEKDPNKLPWKKLGVDVVVEATGQFESFEASRIHLKAGAKRVVMTAPAKDEDSVKEKTVLMGVNEKDMETCEISSNGSCTTNAVSPVIEVLRENPGILKAVLSTVHAYTATQNLVDGPVKGKDFRRGRAAAENITPSTTGAALSVTRAIPELKNKFDGIAFRVPIVAGSIADITFLAKRKTTVEEINDILKKASQEVRWKGILAVTDDPIVSRDILKQPYGAIVDLSFTKVVDGDLVKVLSWYDNEWGYVATLLKHVEVAAQHV